ncbi:hypothetical protein ILUMI_24325 [Ignelater luminosus]|uniref:PiggyBac transposable element-derived protein domain-containing protein n=1 Tax=Ignelater luminosus TaxID=2038154 RepID=A0A8K0CDN2_IGNLU|nr:hypothetical protein ILUMI_24325 [Ignelater luminosus]
METSPEIVDPPYTTPVGITTDCFTRCNTSADYVITVMKPTIKDITYKTNLYTTQRNKALNLKEEKFLSFIDLPRVSNTMSRNISQEILGNLHANDNTKSAKGSTDNIYKIRQLEKTLNKQFANSILVQENYQLTKQSYYSKADLV